MALKVYTKDDGRQDEFQTLRTIVSANPSHPEYRNVQAPLDLIKLQGSRGDHLFSRAQAHVGKLEAAATAKRERVSTCIFSRLA